MEPNAKLFRAIVILGAALTAPGCEGGKCGPNADCAPRTDAGIIIVDARDGGGFPDAFPPGDASMVDVIVII
jgi:hypothetical protein